ncbi:MAG: Trk system potassium transporter TrkA [Spirochaetales bacterium]|jgi:trk system potassium uptake protein TrkA|nr:Trk system potassium transporter TrkA [Spirochaetales bacterium]
MKVVVLGAASRGLQLARYLIEEKNELVIIEPSRRLASQASSQLDCLVITGSGNSLPVLKEAGVGDADFFAALSDSDEVNLVACALAGGESKSLTTAACIRNLTYLDIQDVSESLMGVDYIVNPEAEAAASLYENLEQGGFGEVVTFKKSGLVFHNVILPRDSRFVGKHVKTIRRYMNRYNFLIAGINRESGAFIPSGETVIEGGDVLSMVAEGRGISRIFQTLGKRIKKIRSLLLIGGSKTAWFLLKNYTSRERSRFTLVDRDSETCKLFASQYPEILVIKSDVTDEGLFDDLDPLSYDVILVLTDNDELNIVTALYARKLGLERALILLNNSRYLKLASSLGIDSAVSVPRSTVNSVIRFIRGKRYSHFQSIFDGQIEIYEFTLKKHSDLAEKKLREINMKGHGLIVNINRRGKRLLPSGETVLKPGDTLVVTVERSSLGHIQKLFS